MCDLRTVRLREKHTASYDRRAGSAGFRLGHCGWYKDHGVRQKGADRVQKQRCAIGRALVKNPDILLCDEPAGALDSVSAGEVLEILEKINEKYHTTILIITHNENMAGMADCIIRVHDGKIVSNEKNKKVRVKELKI